MESPASSKRGVTQVRRNGDETCRVRVVCFDIGGVLVRITHSWEEACRRADVPARIQPDRSREAIGGLVLEHQTGRIDCEQFATRYCDIVDGVYTPEEVLAVHKSWVQDEYDGVAELIDTLRSRGLTTAALSNTDARHWQAMADYPFMQRLHHPFASHLMELAKPDPAIYRAAEERLGVTGGQIIFFDDTEENVLAAKGIGWNAHRIDPHGCTATQMRQHLRAASVLD